MKKEIHPKYQEVLFVDSSTGERFICGSTLQPKQTEKYEGKEYPVYVLPISSYSHPFFTKKGHMTGVEGRVEKFNKRYEKAQQRMQQKS